MMNSVFLCLGGNLGEREINLAKAIDLIGKNIGAIKQSSAVYETAAWGTTGQPDYLNKVIEVSTQMSPLQVLEQCMLIEKQLGRTRDIKWESRLMDIDILLYNEEIIDVPELKIPHPYMQDRLFVLTPLHEIAAAYVHPVLYRTIANLLDNCKDQSGIKKHQGNIKE